MAPRNFSSNWKKAAFETENNGPLRGIRVLDMSRLVAGNMASLQLADFGAEVIKIEPLPTGDPLRSWRQGGEATFWKVYARNKKSLGLDFRSSDFPEIMNSLLKTADVLIESFRPGTLEHMGFGIQKIHSFNPGLILLRVSGFGQSGPYSERPGFGTLVESMSGFAHRNGEFGGGPLLPPLALADMISGLYGANAVSMALIARGRDGCGQEIDLALLDSIVSILGPEALDYSLTGRPKPRIGNQSNMAIPRNIYKTKDGYFLSISASTPQMAARLFSTIGHEHMNNDDRFSTNDARMKNREMVDSVVSSWIAARSRDEVMGVFVTAGVTIAPLYSIADICDDPHFIEREIYSEIPDEELGSIPMHKPVPTFYQTPASFRMAAPKLGEHSQEIMQSAGFDKLTIEDFIKRGSVK